MLCTRLQTFPNSCRSLPLDVVGVSDVVALHLLIGVVQHDDGGHKVDNFTGWQLVDITPRITATIAIATHTRVVK